MPESAMAGEQIQELIYEWLIKRYPSGPAWQDPKFDCFGNTAIEIKMIPAFDAVEYNISNGGWAQLLWNCFGRWRDLLGIAQAGYLLIGAKEQSQAIELLREACARDEHECEVAMARAIDEDDFSHFGTFTSRSYAPRNNQWQDTFLAEGLYEKRMQWLAANEARVREVINASDA